MAPTATECSPRAVSGRGRGEAARGCSDDVEAQPVLELTSTDDQQPVEALAADAANPPLHVSVRVRRPHWGADDLDLLARQDGVEGARELSCPNRGSGTAPAVRGRRAPSAGCACCSIQRVSGLLVRARYSIGRLLIERKTSTYGRRSQTVSTINLSVLRRHPPGAASALVDVRNRLLCRKFEFLQPTHRPQRVQAGGRKAGHLARAGRASRFGRTEGWPRQLRGTRNECGRLQSRAICDADTRRTRPTCRVRSSLAAWAWLAPSSRCGRATSDASSRPRRAPFPQIG
jgi:hypothetical protein